MVCLGGDQACSRRTLLPHATPQFYKVSRHFWSRVISLGMGVSRSTQYLAEVPAWVGIYGVSLLTLQLQSPWMWGNPFGKRIRASWLHLWRSL